MIIVNMLAVTITWKQTRNVTFVSDLHDLGILNE